MCKKSILLKKKLRVNPLSENTKQLLLINIHNYYYNYCGIFLSKKWL